MRIAVLADIHGNRRALEAVIADMRFQSPDLVVNLGDHVSGPLQAAETCDLLLAQGRWIHIRGNHDRQVLEPQGLSDRAAASQLHAHHRDWLRSLSPGQTIGGEILLCHGTPQSDLDYLLEQVSGEGVSPAARETVVAHFEGSIAAILCGHSHIPRLVEFGDGRIALNPGSVGLQAYDDPDHKHPHVMEAGTPHARYALLDRIKGRWRTAFKQIEYDWDAAAQVAAGANRPDWAHALRTGYALKSER